jgi:hypothetical protein
MYLACGLYLTLGREYGRARCCLLNYYRVQENITERVTEQELLTINLGTHSGYQGQFSCLDSKNVSKGARRSIIDAVGCYRAGHHREHRPIPQIPVWKSF